MAITQKWDSDQMQDLSTITDIAHKGIQDALTAMGALYSDMEADSTWEGGHKVAFMAWLDLLRQYHGKLADAKIGGDAVVLLNKFVQDASAFYTDSAAMKALENIG